MVQLTISIYDEHSGDIDVDVDVIGPETSLVMYDMDELAVILGVEEVPEHIDRDVREKAVDLYLDLLAQEDAYARS